MSDLPVTGFDARQINLSRAPAMPRAPGVTSARGDTPAVAKAAGEFEAMFISQMLQHMWAGIEVDPNFGGGHGEEMFRSIMIEEQGKLMAKAGGFGLAAEVKRAMLQMQEVAEENLQ